MVLRRVPPALRGVALVPIAGLAVHQLRFMLAFGGDAGHELAVQGHAYLGHLVPWIMLAAGFGAGALLGRVSSAWRAPSRAVPAPVSFLRLWLLTALVLIGIYVGQELLEGWLATGHPVGVAGVLGAGGWTALPAASAVGLLLAGILFVAELLVERLAAGHVPAVRRPAALALRRIAVHLAAPGPMASAAPGRAPPATA
jgi:hypothetical protein